MRPLCIYHGHCADGFGAAWAVWKALRGDVDLHPGFYSQGPPDVSARDVIIVDFSYKRPVLEEMAMEAHSVLILDHHKSAADDLASLPEPPAYWTEWMEDRLAQHPAIAACFDMDRSGAGLAWDYFHPGEDRPPLIDHIEDRDLWRFRLDGTREIQAALFSYPYDMETWDKLISNRWRGGLDQLRAEGEAIMRKQLKDTAELIEAGLQWWEIGTVTVPVINLPYTMGSEAGHMLLGLHSAAPFVGYYWDKGGTRYWGLRSRGDADVAEVAKQYGGGGHATASGFELPHGASTAPRRAA